MKQNGPNGKPTSWLLVVSLLVVLPLLTTVAMKLWMGVPDESRQPGPIFARVGLSTVPTLEQHALKYGHLFFGRLRLHPEGVQDFYRQLSDFERAGGEAEPPIALKLEREWWDPDPTVPGTYWRRGDVTLWSPDGEPDLIYAVVRVP